MNVLILGGDGFIGSHLLEAHINRGDICVVVDINSIRTRPDDDRYLQYTADLSKEPLEEIIERYSPDFIYNCVAVATPAYYVKYPIQTYELDFEVNYRKICLPIIAAGIPFIQFSTSEVYGKNWEEVHHEDTTDLILGPTHKSRWIYATSKILLEQLLIAHNADCCIVRPQNFCGWDMDWLPDISNNNNNTWIPRLPACWMNSLLTKQPLVVVGSGLQSRCYTHISDAITALLSIIDNWKACTGQTINIGNRSNERHIIQLARIYLDTWKSITGERGSIVFRTAEEIYGAGYEDCERRNFDDHKLHKLTGWTPKIDIHMTILDILSEIKARYHK